MEKVIFMGTPILIGIAGSTSSGKTRIANEIINCLPDISKSVKRDISGVIFGMDWYYKNRSDLSFKEREKINYDHPDAFEWPLMYNQILALSQNKEVERPIYSFKKHLRTGSKIIKPADLIIVEGILTLHNKKIYELMDDKFFVYTPQYKCFIRRLIRDIKERDRTIYSVISQWIRTVGPGYKNYILPSRENADYIIKGEGKIKESINPIVEVIKEHFDTMDYKKN